jgi:hypothetical protein
MISGFLITDEIFIGKSETDQSPRLFPNVSRVAEAVKDPLALLIVFPSARMRTPMHYTVLTV